MAWRAIVFETKRGEKPVEKFIDSLDKPTIAKIIHIVDLLEKYGPYLGVPHSKKLTGRLFELRIRGKQEVRIVYSVVNQDIYLLHAFKKKKQKTPAKELKTALRRLHSIK